LGQWEHVITIDEELRKVHEDETSIPSIAHKTRRDDDATGFLELYAACMLASLVQVPHVRTQPDRAMKKYPRNMLIV
jgi:hypothetical protein